MHQTEKHPKSWNFWGDRIFTNFQQSPFPKKWRQISKIMKSVRLRAKHTSFYMDHKAIQYSACSVHYATANSYHFLVWMQTIKTSIRRYSGEKNHSGLVGCIIVLRPFDAFWAVSREVSQPIHTVRGQASILRAHSFTSNWQVPFLNQRKGNNGLRNFFMTKFSYERMYWLLGSNPRPSAYQAVRASDWASAPG